MELGLNPPLPDGRPLPAGTGTRAPAEPTAMYAETAGEIAVGRFVVEVGQPGGAVLRDAMRAERAHFRPRPTPIAVRPRVHRGLVDRRIETAAAISAIDAGVPVEVSGAPGVGKTALLRHIAHHPRAATFADGVVYVSARHRTSIDLLQAIFEAFYESDTICKPTGGEIRRALQDTHALILIDDVSLPQNEVEQVLDIAPHAAFVLAGRKRCLWGEVRSIALTGLTAEDGALLLEHELERSLDADEQSAAAQLCAAVEGHPRRLLQAAADIRLNRVPVADWTRYASPDALAAELMTSMDERQRRVLLALSALSGVSLEARHVSALAELTDVEPSLNDLVDRRLLVRGQSGYRLADGIGDRLRRTADLSPWVHRAITYFTAWAERQRRNRETLLQASDALLHVQAHAADTHRWGETLRLGRLLESTLVVGARWGAWGLALEQCLVAAKAIGDRSVEAWVLHEMGTRAVCLGDEGNARRLLNQSATLRQALMEHGAAAISRRNLSTVPAPVADDSHDAPAPVAAAAPSFDSVPFRSAVATPDRRRTTNGAGALMFMFLACAILGGLASYGGVFDGLLANVRRASGSVSSQPPAPKPRTAAATPLPLRDTTEVVMHDSRQSGGAAARANILIFTARPGSIATARSTSLCYAVSDASRARIEPGVGDVDPAGTLTCRRVAPVRTTTYELSATGRDGVPITQHLVIVVR